MSAPGGRTLPAFDVYAELGIARGATPEQVRAAYRRKAKQFHPDIASDPAAAEARMKRINQARDVLLDPARRAEYDGLRATPRAAGRADSAAGAEAERERRARAERERWARAERERRARAQAEQARWEREAEERAAEIVAARRERRRSPRAAGPRAGERGRPAATSASARARPGTRDVPRPSAGGQPTVLASLRMLLGSRVTLEVRVGPAGATRRWKAGS